MSPLPSTVVVALLLVTPAPSGGTSDQNEAKLSPVFAGKAYVKGKWVSPTEAKAKGYFQYRGRWLPTKLSSKLKRWERLDAKTKTWKKRYKFKTKNYRVDTDLPRFITELELKPFLNELYKVYVKVFRSKFGLTGKAANMKDLRIYRNFPSYSVNEPRTDGSPRPRTNPGFIRDGVLLVTFYEDTDPARFYKTMFHEGAHQFFKAMLPSASLPMWLNEGLAVYFEGCRYSRATQKIVIGHVSPKRLRLAHSLLRGYRNNQNPGLANELFFSVPKPSFHAKQYAMAWSFLHYLIHRKGDSRVKVFHKFLRKMNGSGTRTVRDVFKRETKEDLAEVEKGWLKHVFSLTPARSSQWVIVDSMQIGESKMVYGDLIWSLGGIKIYDRDHLDEVWGKCDFKADVELVLIRASTSASPDGYGRKRISITLPGGSGITLPTIATLARSSCLID